MKKILIQKQINNSITLLVFKGEFSKKVNNFEYPGIFFEIKDITSNLVLNKFFFKNSLIRPFLFSNSLVFLFQRQIFSSLNSLFFLLKEVKFMLKGITQMFFYEFRIVGLGYKVFKDKELNKLKVLSFKIGFSHVVQYIIPSNIHVLTGRRRLFVYTNDYHLIKNIHKTLFFIKKLNVYKHKGLINFKEEIKLKEGKKQQK